MVNPTRLVTSFVFLAIFISLHFASYSHQAMEKSMRVLATGSGFVEGGHHPSSTKKEVAVVTVTMTTRRDAKRAAKIGGRKLITVKKVLTAEGLPTNGELSWELIGGDRRKRRRRRSGGGRYRHHHNAAERKVMSSFMALNADYHVPKSHPPKNN